MLTLGFMYIVYECLDILLNFHIPMIPPEVHEYISYALEFVTSGASLLANYTPLVYLLSLFSIIAAVDVGLMIYEIVMWVVRKIPMASIE